MQQCTLELDDESVIAGTFHPCAAVLAFMQDVEGMGRGSVVAEIWCSRVFAPMLTDYPLESPGFAEELMLTLVNGNDSEVNISADEEDDDADVLSDGVKLPDKQKIASLAGLTLMLVFPRIEHVARTVHKRLDQKLLRGMFGWVETVPTSCKTVRFT